MRVPENKISPEHDFAFTCIFGFIKKANIWSSIKPNKDLSSETEHVQNNKDVRRSERLVISDQQLPSRKKGKRCLRPQCCEVVPFTNIKQNIILILSVNVFYRVL